MRHWGDISFAFALYFMDSFMAAGFSEGLRSSSAKEAEVNGLILFIVISLVLGFFFLKVLSLVAVCFRCTRAFSCWDQWALDRTSGGILVV